VALYRLGASSDTLNKFFQSYIQRLEPKIPPRSDLLVSKYPSNTDIHWYSLLGKEKNFPELEKFFISEVQNEETESLLSHYFPKLAEGLGGGAFHGLLELGYNLEIEPDSPSLSKKLLPTGLAYLTYSYASYGKPQWIIDDRTSLQRILSSTFNSEALPFSPIKALTSLYSDPIFNGFYHRNTESFGGTMNRLASEEKYLKQLSHYDIPLPRPLFTSLELFYEKNDLSIFIKEIESFMQVLSLTVFQLLHYTRRYSFFLLHAITSMRALKVVIRSLLKCTHRYPNNGIAIINSLGYYWRALVCTYITQGRPQLVIEENVPCKRDWDDLVKELLGRVPEYNDEHVIKLVYVAREEDLEVKREIHREISENIMKVIKYESDWIFLPSEPNANL
jgi:hypothetical protein